MALSRPETTEAGGVIPKNGIGVEYSIRYENTRTRLYILVHWSTEEGMKLKLLWRHNGRHNRSRVEAEGARYLYVWMSERRSLFTTIHVEYMRWRLVISINIERSRSDQDASLSKRRSLPNWTLRHRLIPRSHKNLIVLWFNPNCLLSQRDGQGKRVQTISYSG